MLFCNRRTARRDVPPFALLSGGMPSPSLGDVVLGSLGSFPRRPQFRVLFLSSLDPHSCLYSPRSRALLRLGEYLSYLPLPFNFRWIFRGEEAACGKGELQLATSLSVLRVPRCRHCNIISTTRQALTTEPAFDFRKRWRLMSQLSNLTSKL